MIDESASAFHWDALHAQPRFRPRYPAESVVRFLFGSSPGDRSGLSALDIGVGGGRHARLLCEMGFVVSGLDISAEGLEQCRRILQANGLAAVLKQGSMHDLPFPSANFDVAVSYGVFNYTDLAGMRRAVAELHRVLKPGASAFVMVRTRDDYRFGKGECLEPGTYRLEINETNERGTVQHFLSEEDVPDLFGAFSRLSFERSETSFAERTEKHSDWLITVRR